MKVRLPESLYKFLPLDKKINEEIHDSDGKVRFKNGFDAIEDILVKNRIYYSKPRYFNNPSFTIYRIERISNAPKS